MDSPKERFDACMKLAEFWSARADARRLFESRMIFGFCALMVAIIVYLPRNAFSIFFVICTLAAFVLLFMRGNWAAATKDKAQAWYFVDAAIEMVADPTFKVNKLSKEKMFKEKLLWRFFFEDWSQEVQIGIVTLFGLAFWLLPQIARLPI